MSYPAIPYRAVPGFLEREVVSEIRYGDWLELVVVERAIEIDIGGEGSVSGTIQDFYPGTTLVFTATCYLNDVAQNITGDTLTVFVKTNKSDADSAALVRVNADVATQGASGIATFTLTPTHTTIATGTKYLEIVWITAAGAEYVPHQQKITVLERVSDT